MPVGTLGKSQAFLAEDRQDPSCRPEHWRCPRGDFHRRWTWPLMRPITEGPALEGTCRNLTLAASSRSRAAMWSPRRAALRPRHCPILLRLGGGTRRGASRGVGFHVEVVIAETSRMMGVNVVAVKGTLLRVLDSAPCSSAGCCIHRLARMTRRSRTPAGARNVLDDERLPLAYFGKTRPSPGNQIGPPRPPGHGASTAWWEMSAAPARTWLRKSRYQSCRIPSCLCS